MGSVHDAHHVRTQDGRCRPMRRLGRPIEEEVTRDASDRAGPSGNLGQGGRRQVGRRRAVDRCTPIEAQLEAGPAAHAEAPHHPARRRVPARRECRRSTGPPWSGRDPTTAPVTGPRDSRLPDRVQGREAHTGTTGDRLPARSRQSERTCSLLSGNHPMGGTFVQPSPPPQPPSSWLPSSWLPSSWVCISR